MTRGLSVIFLIFFMFSISRATVHHVAPYESADGDNSGGRASIQTAIDAAAPGDTVFVSQGTYPENITINKALTLAADSGNIMPVEIVPGGGVGIDILSFYVTVQGMTIHDVSAGIEAFLTEGEPGALNGLPFIRLMDNVIYDVENDSLGFGILVGTASERYNPDDPLGIYNPNLFMLLDFTGLRISGNEIYNTSGDGLAMRSLTHELLEPPLIYDNNIHDSQRSGIWIDAVQAINLVDNIVENNDRGVLFTNFGDGYYEGTENNGYDPKNISLTGCTISGNTEIGVAVYDGYPGLLHFTDNEISSNGINFLNYLETTVDAEENYWGALLCGAIAATLSGNVDYDPWCDPYLSTCEMTCDLQEAWVDDNYCDVCHNDLHYWKYNAFASVQEAVNAVKPGGTIHVRSGNYAEQLIIDKSITISGSQGATVVPPPEGLAGFSFDEVNGIYYPMVLAYGGSADGSGHISGLGIVDATITGLTIKGNGVSNEDNLAGILFRNGGVSSEASGNTIKQLHASENAPESYGIVVIGNSDVFLGSNNIQEFSRGGIYVIGDDGALSDPQATISNNTITGDGPLGADKHAQFGIAVIYGALAAITGNDISEMRYIPGTDTACGIDINYPGSGIVINGNTISNCESAANLNFLVNATVGNNNIFSENDYMMAKNCAGVVFNKNNYISNGSALHIINSTNISVTNGYFSGNDYAVQCDGSSSTINITGNTFSGTDISAIAVNDLSGIEPSGVHVNFNSFIANTQAIDNNTLIVLDAAGNWWGNAGGPGISGNDVSSYVDYSPWWGGNYISSGHSSPWIWVLDSSNSSNIQEGVNFAADGDTVRVLPGLYHATINIENRNNLSIVSISRDSTTYAPTSRIDWAIGPVGDTMSTAIRIIGSQGISFAGMTFDFNGARADNASGILCWNSAGSWQDCRLQGMDVPDASGGYDDITVYAGATEPSFDTNNRARLEFLNNEFINTGRNAVWAEGWTDLSIEDNSFMKDEPDFGFGVELGSTAVGSLLRNTFDGFNTEHIVNQESSAAVRIHNAGTSGLTGISKSVTVRENDIHNSQFGLVIGNAEPGMAGDVDIVADIVDNSISGCDAGGGDSGGGLVVVDEDADAGSTVSLNLAGNEISASGRYGALIYTNGNGHIGATITGNYFVGNNMGLAVKNLGAPGGSIYDIEVYHNLFDNNLDAEDDAAGGYWDDGVSEGNCWQNFGGNPGDQYTVAGSAGTIDRFANVYCDNLCDCRPGNADGDVLRVLNLLDILYVITGIYQDGPEAVPYATCSGDANCDCQINLLDILTLIENIYFEGEAPCSCGEWLTGCHAPLR